MKLTTFTKALALLAAAIILLAAEVVIALPSSDIGIIEGVEVPKGYAIAPLHLTGTINGVTVDHNGTIEEAFAQLEAEHPELGADLTAASSPDAKSPDKRYMTDVHCIPVSGQNWRRANDVVIGQGIKYLRNNNLVCGVNPHSCSRVSCSYDSAIWVCNNNNEWIGPDCKLIASFAQALRDRCYFTDGIHDPATGGQAWDNENWNVNIAHTPAPNPQAAPDAAAYILVSLTFGLSLTTNVWAFYRVTGGLFNPAVTLALWLCGGMSTLRSILVIPAQLIAGVAAAGAIAAIYPGPMDVDTVLGGGTSITPGLFIEVF
ncbi:hypothetical protein IFR04_013427 [Cadophora malorum]|uniref:Uncharacterized protein n=1 Tax=Cadophora malorum TaxID=108018 RepID=A0A8H7T6N7_9HELO|nr:hypothetical protein IFR04_013427 [Cadophora malorum]